MYHKNFNSLLFSYANTVYNRPLPTFPMSSFFLLMIMFHTYTIKIKSLYAHITTFFSELWLPLKLFSFSI